MQENEIVLLELWRKEARINFLHLLHKNKLCIHSHSYLKLLGYRITSLSPAFVVSTVWTDNTNRFSYFPEIILDWNSLSFDILVSDDFPTALHCHLVENWFVRTLYFSFSEFCCCVRSASCFMYSCICMYFFPHWGLTWSIVKFSNVYATLLALKYSSAVFSK